MCSVVARLPTSSPPWEQVSGLVEHQPSVDRLHLPERVLLVELEVQVGVPSSRVRTRFETQDHVPV